MVEGVQEVFVADDAAEDALVVAEEDEGELASNCYGGAEFEAATVPKDWSEMSVHVAVVCVVWKDMTYQLKCGAWNIVGEDFSLLCRKQFDATHDQGDEICEVRSKHHVGVPHVSIPPSSYLTARYPDHITRTHAAC